MESDSESERRAETKKPKSRRPPNNAFRQQRLKAWQPILTPKTVLPLFFGVTCLFALFGGLLLKASADVQELIIDYTHCDTRASSDFADIDKSLVEYSFKHKAEPSTLQWRHEGEYPNSKCTLRFDIPDVMGHPVYMFYRLTNFYQNHRRYVLSYNERQLNGFAETTEDLKSTDDCKPLTLNADGKAYYPCGLIANSLFNDTFSAPVLQSDDGSSSTYAMTNNGIAWSSDKNRFKKTQYNASDVVPPPNWAERYPDGYNDTNMPDLSEWEELQNWMRTAGLPTFSKLALRNDNDDFGPGIYEVEIGMNFNTTVYNGKKMMVISTRTAIGGKNNFLGIAYIVVAALCCALGITFLLHHLIRPRRMGDHTYLSWNKERS